jgi:hypothetical protein
LLLFPRSRVHGGDVASVARFKELGKRLLDAHVLFDVLPDDHAPAAERRRYLAVVDSSDARVVPSNVMSRLPSSLSRFEVPATVRVSASRPAVGNEITLHFVNYNREVPADKKNPAHGIKNEKPIAVPLGEVDLKLDPKLRVRQIEFLTPEAEAAREVEFEQRGTRLGFRVPEFLVYGVVRIQLSN